MCCASFPSMGFKNYARLTRMYLVATMISTEKATFASFELLMLVPSFPLCGDTSLKIALNENALLVERNPRIMASKVTVKARIISMLIINYENQCTVRWN